MPGNIFAVLKYRLLLQISRTKLVSKMIHMNIDKLIAVLIHTVQHVKDYDL